MTHHESRVTDHSSCVPSPPQTVNGTPHSPLRLPPGSAQVIEFRYTAAAFVAPDEIRFRYRLVDLSDQWLDAGSRREAYFTELRPGDYRFEVMACNHHGVWPGRGATVAFHLAPFVYQTWWFYVVCGLATTGRSAQEALAVLPGCRPDIVLIDIQLAGRSGIDCVRELQPRLPDTQFMMLTVVEDHELIFRSLAAGATGYLLKKTVKTQPAKLLEAIRDLHAGGAPMSGQIARHVVATFREPGAAAPVEPKLSPTERDVLQRLARGLLYKEVAEELTVSISTVRTHVWHIYRKLHAHNRTEAILRAMPERRG